MNLGDTIRKVRIKKGYSQQFLADTIGISQSKLNRIENGQTEITAKDLLNLCEVLKVNPSEMLEKGSSDNQNIPPHEYPEHRKRTKSNK